MYQRRRGPIGAAHIQITGLVGIAQQTVTNLHRHFAFLERGARSIACDVVHLHFRQAEARRRLRTSYDWVLCRPDRYGPRLVQDFSSHRQTSSMGDRIGGDALSRPAVLLLAPGHALYGMCIIISLSAFFGGPTLFAPQSLLSDAVDYDFMRSGVNKAGNIFSMNTLLEMRQWRSAGAGR